MKIAIEIIVAVGSIVLAVLAAIEIVKEFRCSREPELLPLPESQEVK